MSWIDWFVLIITVSGVIGVGLLFGKKASENTDNFIVGGRKIPWWLAGVSILATGLNANTPLVDSRKIRQDGISGLWFNWQAFITGVIASIWFNRLWRRSGVATAVEIYELRYASRSAKAARIFDVSVIGLFNGCIWGAVGLVGMKKIALVLFGLPPTFDFLGLTFQTDWVIVLVSVSLALGYSAVSGIYGVVWTDLIEMVIAVFCTALIFFLVFSDVGWSTGLREKIDSLGKEGEKLLYMLPEFGPALIVLFFIQPLMSQGHINPGVQKILAVRDERETIFTFYFSTALNIIAKNWPIYIAGLAGIFLIADDALLERFAAVITENGEKRPDYEMVYPLFIERYLPTGLIGLMMAGFLFAFMSSQVTTIHIAGSLFVNDLYRPFLNQDAEPGHYVNVARITMCVVTVASILVGVFSNDILFLMILALTLHNSQGFVKFARFLWWRVNGPSEFGGQLAGLAATLFFFASPWGSGIVDSACVYLGQDSNDAYYAMRYLMVLSVSCTISLLLIYLLPSEPEETLKNFYRRLQPYGAWGKIAKACPESHHQDPLLVLWAMTAAGLGFTFGLNFLMIGLLLAFWTMAWIAGVITVLSIAVLWWGVRKLYPEAPSQK